MHTVIRFLVVAMLTTAPLVAAPPNIVVIVADDLGYGELSCQNAESDIPTPNIDAIAAAGVRFTDGYVTAPFCAASRAGLLTGRYQTRFGFEFNPIGARNEDPDAGLPETETTLAETLKDGAGYTTGMIGKWHLGGTAHYNPIRRGFDTFYGFLHEGHYYVPPPYDDHVTWLRRKTLPPGTSGERWTSRDGRTVYTSHMGHNEPAYDADNPLYRAGQPVSETENLTDAFTREAVSFIEDNADRPFFLYLAYNAVHSPLQGRDDYLKKFEHIDDIQRRIFAAMLSQLDDGVGKVTAALRDAGLEENTLVFFLSDNGGPTAELTSSNAPLRGGKGGVYEGGLRIPFIAKWPGVIPAGKTYDRPVLSLDIFATAIALAGIDPPKNRQLDGVNLLPFLKGENQTDPHDEIFWRVGNRGALRSGDWKLVRNPGKGESNAWQLYRLDEDIAEEANVAEKEPEKLQQLIERWEAHNSEMVEPLWR
ncbi:MAG: sulfatase-like hydrolase/transferase [Verrucomicrobiae bacterium]|nr:sulfatase-like hydrolase/transferase [Verrucomicrobiae bacterium]